MRNRVVEEMRGDWASYEPFVEPDLHTSYLSSMARSTEYAGEPELVALSKVYGVTIRVWGADAAHDRDVRVPSVGADAPVVHLAQRDARNFRDHYFAVQFSERREVRSIMAAKVAAWQFEVESVAAYEGATEGMDGSAALSSFDDHTDAPPLSTSRNVLLDSDVAAPYPGVRLIASIAAQSSGSSPHCASHSPAFAQHKIRGGEVWSV
jgi:hypothetical protein